MRASLRVDLTAAIKSRDRVAVTALRSALAAIDNAESVPAEHSPGASTSTGTGGTGTGGTGGTGGQHIAGAVSGLGATEAERRHLTEADLRAILETEITDRATAAANYEQLGRADQATQLHAEAQILRRYL
jgi:uncharacterized protein YqeY